jgi:hypothetical protein
MIPRDFRSQENGKRMSRSEGSSFTEAERSTRVSYLMMSVMARESNHIQKQMSTRETFKMG